MNHSSRVEALRAKLGDAGIDGLLVTNLTNVLYLTGFSGSNGQVLVTPDKTVFLSDPRYAARSKALVQGADIDIYPDRISDRLGDHFPSGRLGIEGATMTISARDELAEDVDGIELVPTKDLVEELRRVKDGEEVEIIRRASAIADQAFEWACQRLTPGVTEREVALVLEVRMRETGADAVSFEPIVGSGPLSAHIHHTPGDRVLEKGDLVLLDFGCKVGGYCSDMTRTVVLGPATNEQRDIYSTVLAAHNAGIDALSAGVAGSAVDAAAREVIERAGYGEAFGHGLGHGVGIDIHEAPRLHRISKDTLLAGDVVTIEPGVYLDDLGGIRIEDCALVTESGCHVLTSAPKAELLEL